jgi:hypothetical protein
MERRTDVDEIKFYEGEDSPLLDWSKGHSCSYQFEGGSLSPNALACSKVTGSTLRSILVPSGGCDLQN